MTIAVFTNIWATESSPEELRRNFLEQQLEYLQSESVVESVDLYMPAKGEVPSFDDGPPAALIIQADVQHAADARKLTQSERFQKLLADKSTYSPLVEKVSVDILETVHFPIPGHQAPPPRTATLSFVVRYYGPTADEAAFVRFYTEHHPLLLATFPAIRNVLCYLPPGWQITHEVTDSRVILGNEVVFDDLESLNRALASDVLPRLKAEGKQFASFGCSTHHAMRRERVYTRGGS